MQDQCPLGWRAAGARHQLRRFGHSLWRHLLGLCVYQLLDGTVHTMIRGLGLILRSASTSGRFGIGVIMLAALSSFAVSGCVTLKELGRPSGEEPYLHKVLGPNVWVRVPAGGLTLQEAIDWSVGWAQEHCEWAGDDKGTYFVAADRAFMDKSEYEVTWRCCRPDDECCLRPESEACSQDQD